jgi:hypothetical protein
MNIHGPAPSSPLSSNGGSRQISQAAKRGGGGRVVAGYAKRGNYWLFQPPSPLAVFCLPRNHKIMNKQSRKQLS